ncbi:beta-N-acetylhexosaminidase [Lutibacter flavus]|uniref:Hexosaminidase n=1 Tax=Lutibacter flavus TaxID=691689 RepID=A0A238YSS0_9FLAO|nr:family 20 glycosylhydrolase [Lutibacter flavus]SNR73868.1 hexosaminidase [Lutibacter flavus]
MKKLIFVILAIVSNLGIAQKNELNLMPWPQEITIGNEQFIIEPNFNIGISNNSSERIKIATTKFLRRLSGRTGVFIDEGFAFTTQEILNPSLEISFQRIGNLVVNEDESYHLEVTKSTIKITAITDLGVLHALETLLQLVNNNENSYYFTAATIKDSPRFTWRGLMIDVARHFEPVDVIKRNLDAMAAVKMNVFHWHLTDDQGFRIESKTHPKLHELGSDGLYYTQEQIKDIVKYAGERGIRVIPEVDVPGHATAILTAYPEIGSKDTSYSIERFSGIFDPTLDPTNEKTYEILGDLFGEMALLFPDKYFHIGGDENEGKHWDENEHIQEFKKVNNLESNHDLQTYMNIRLADILAKHGKLVMGWEEIMTDNMPITALIHSWKGENEGIEGGSSLEKAAEKGYKTVLSDGYYIDLMQPAIDHYLVNPLPKNNNLTAEEKARILGGEATMWSELVTSLTIDSRIWPRTAAIAERLWSSEEVTDVSNMYKRLETISFRLEELGINHIRNRDVILRNITNNQNIEWLKTLTKIYEPIKIYSRNKGGTEYKTFSPFTLFADACSADASDGIIFNKLVNDFISTSNENSKKEIIAYLKKWSDNYSQFILMKKKSPILRDIEPISKNLSEIATTLLSIIDSEKLKKVDLNNSKEQLLKIKNPVVDVELIIFQDLKKLTTFLINEKK